MTGKCILTPEYICLTPVEFQLYSGCASADWKSAVKIFMPPDETEKVVSTKKSNLKSIKTLIDEGFLKLTNTESPATFVVNLSRLLMFEFENV